MFEKPCFEVDFDIDFDWDWNAVHFHIDECPMCKNKRAATDQYHSVQDCINDEDGIFTCEECNSEFQIIEYDYCREPKEALIQLL